MGQRAAAAPGWHDGDLLAAGGMTGERRVDRARRPGRGAPNEGQIRAGQRQALPVIGEELGLRVTLVVVFCYLLIVTSGILISLNAKDRFGMLLGFGCTAILGLQAAINIGVTTSLFPNKGLPLPFISYGGSNVFFCLICVGILINIYRQGKEDKTTSSTEMMVRVRHVSRI